MDFKTSIETCFTKYTDFSGRATRSEFWWFQLLYFIVYIIAFCIKPVLAFIVILGFFLPLLAVAIRRLHDTNRSGWWIFITLIPLIGAIIYIYFLVLEGTKGPNQYGN